MKKIKWIAAFAVVGWLGAAAPLASAQVVDRGGVRIDFYYGFPNLWSTALRTLVNEVQTPGDLQTRSVGPVGGRIEFLVTRRFGVGLDVHYARSEVAYTAVGEDLEGNAAAYRYTVSVRRPRVLLRGNLHLGNSAVVDPYLAFGLGYSGTRAVIATEDPFFDRNTIRFPITIPLAYRLGFGTRVMLTRFIGLSGEIGIGGPFLTGGVTIGI
ncbi:MAG: hypothetical protein AAF998_00020 [Bacteroidota bacterium]